MDLLFVLVFWTLIRTTKATSGSDQCGQYISPATEDTCEQLRIAFQLTPAKFEELNPNLNCRRLSQLSTKICVASQDQVRTWKSDPNRSCPGSMVKVIEGDTCAKIGNRLDVDEAHFNFHNPNIDCSNLSPGITVCGAVQENSAQFEETGTAPSEPRDDESTCLNDRRVQVEEGDSCQSIMQRYGISLQRLKADNPSLDCNSIWNSPFLCIQSRESLEDRINTGATRSSAGSSSTRRYSTSTQKPPVDQNLPVGQDLPIHQRPVTRCPGKFVTAKGNETCSYFRQQHNIDSEQEFTILNPTINCSQGATAPRGLTICIKRPRIVYAPLPYKRPRGIENAQMLAVHCVSWGRVQSEDTCWTMRNMARLSERDFYALNPGLDCASLKAGQQICLKNRTIQGKSCRLTFAVKSSQTCSSIASLANLSLDQLKSLNPDIDCDRLEPKMQVCLSVDDPFDTESRESERGSNASADNFLRSASARLSERSLIDSNTAREIERLLNNQGAIGPNSDALIQVLAKQESIPLIKAVTEGNPNFRRLSSEFDQRRGLICVQLTEGRTAYKECVCNNDKPFLHCQAVLLKNLREGANNRPPKHKRRHSKRMARTKNVQRDRSTSPFSVTPTIAMPTSAKPTRLSNAMKDVGKAFSDFWKFFQKLCPNCLEEGCLAAGVCFIVPQAPVFQICVSGGACFPNPAMLITTDQRLTVNQFFSSQVSVGVGVCITGVNAVFKLVGMEACVISVDLRYYYLRQQLELHPQIALVAVRAYLSALVQVGNSVSTGLYDSEVNAPLIDLCLEEAYQCNDFCQLDRGGAVVKYNVEVWFFGWRSVVGGDIKGLPECQPKKLPPPETLKRLAIFISGPMANASDEYCKRHENPIKYLPVNASITHLIYASLSIDQRNFRLIDTGQRHFIDELSQSKSGSMKIMVSVGGRSFSEDNSTKTIFSGMARSSANRKAFINSVIDYLNQRSLDGLDIAWLNIQQEDKSSFTSLIRELREAIDRSGKGLVLSISAPRSAKNIDTWLIHQNVDFINLMTFDYHEARDSYKPDAINVHTPVVDCACSEQGDIEFTVEEYLNGGAPAQKLNLGLATYGRVFKLDKNWRLEDESGGYVSGECTKTPGLLAWYEVKTRIEDIRIDNKTMSAYSAYGNMEWVGFDNQQTHSMKMCFARYKLLGGVSVWNANYDDHYELIASISRSISAPASHNCTNEEISKCDADSDAGRRRSSADKTPEMDESGLRASKPAQSASTGSGTPTCSSLAPADSKRCSPAICTTPPSVINGDKAKLSTCANKPAGHTCVIQCLPGFTVSSLTATVVCVRLFSSFAIWLPSAKCEMSQEGRRLCGGETQSPVVPIFANSNSTSQPLYIIKYDKAIRMLSWSAYLSRKIETSSPGESELRFSRYHCHKEDQIRASYFRNLTGYVKSQLTPQIAVSGGAERRATNYMINIAAQERNTKYGPWTVLERRVNSFSRDYPSIVASGVCPITIDRSSISDNGTNTVPISTCFWKMVCVKAGGAGVTVGVFFHENTGSTGVSPSSDRVQQIKTIRDQSFLKQKLSANALDEIWKSVKQWLLGNVSSNSYPSSEACAAKLSMENAERQLWQPLIDNRRYGPDWREFDEEAALYEANHTDDEDEGMMSYGVRKQPYTRCGRVINDQRPKRDE